MSHSYAELGFLHLWLSIKSDSYGLFKELIIRKKNGANRSRKMVNTFVRKLSCHRLSVDFYTNANIRLGRIFLNSLLIYIFIFYISSSCFMFIKSFFVLISILCWHIDISSFYHYKICLMISLWRL